MFSFFRNSKSVDIRQERRNVANLCIGIASITFFTIVAQIVLVNALAIFAPQLALTYTVKMFISAITMYGIGMPLSMTFFNRCPVTPAEKKNLPISS